jgi:hypothetical protein
MRAVSAIVPLALLALTGTAGAHPPTWRSPSGPVAVSVEVEERATPLYAAPDGSGRLYLEARQGARYSLRLNNPSPHRVAILLAVDGLNVISGEREPGPRAGRPGRMYVLEPWDEMTVRGWRTSLEEVRRFTFVDEKRSYASRTGQANSKMGWIEAWVYHEVRPRPVPLDRVTPRSYPHPGYEEDRDASAKRERSGEAADSAGAAPAPPATMAPPPSERAEASGARNPKLGRADGRADEGYPGTGWGAREDDHATVVQFEAQPAPAQTIVLRYEYARALRALGIPAYAPPRDRLAERDRGDGFARPPQW